MILKNYIWNFGIMCLVGYFFVNSILSIFIPFSIMSVVINIIILYGLSTFLIKSAQLSEDGMKLFYPTRICFRCKKLLYTNVQRICYENAPVSAPDVLIITYRKSNNKSKSIFLFNIDNSSKKIKKWLQKAADENIDIRIKGNDDAKNYYMPHRNVK